MSLNLDSLLRNLEAGTQIEKTASTTETAKPAISAQLADVLEKKASEDVVKKASEQGEAAARELLAKLANNILDEQAVMVASDDAKVTSNETGGDVESVLQSTVDKAVASGATTEDRVSHEAQVNNVTPAGGPVGTTEKQAEETPKENTMNKSAEDKTLAQLIMEKFAQEFSPMVTTPAAAVNVAAAPVPNKIQQDNAVMTAQDDAKVQGVVPGGDGTVNSLFETIVAKAKADGGQSDDLINGPAHVQSQPVFANNEVEKAAAVASLCDEGMDFDTAVALVKQAEEALDAESWEQEKQAAFSGLVDAGYDFDTAVALVKQAEEEMIAQAQKAE
jgi:hypothetical protein